MDKDIYLKEVKKLNSILKLMKKEKEDIEAELKRTDMRYDMETFQSTALTKKVLDPRPKKHKTLRECFQLL